MATLYITNHLYPDNPQLFVIDFKQVVKLRGEPNTSFAYDRRGERYWEAVIYTSGLDSNGDSLGPYWVHEIGSESTLNELIQSKINEVAQEIDWSKSALIDEEFQAKADRYSPVIYWTYPSDEQTNVPIDSTIIVRIKDLPPAKGIDISTLSFKVGGYSVSPEVSGNKYDYTLSYRPQVGK